MDGRPSDRTFPGVRSTIHGVTESNEYITMLDAVARLSGYSIKSQSVTESISIIANYMLVGTQHFDQSPSVRRLSFSSSVVEHVLRLQARPDYKDIRHRRAGGTTWETPVLHKQVASYVDLSRKIRLRVFRPRVPATTIEPKSFLTIDFLDLVTPKQAVKTLHEFRSLLTLICGELIDFWDVQLLHKIGSTYTASELYFNDPVKHPLKSDQFPIAPIVDICQDRALFRRIVGSWLAETPDRRMERGAFALILQDKGTLRLSHLRELVTIIEMKADSDGMTPLVEKAKARGLRQALKKAAEHYAADDVDSQSWLETIKKRIDYINSYDAKLILKKFIVQLPEQLIAVPPTFHSDVVELRNTLVHALERLRTDDWNKLSFFVAKLKAAYALSDVIALGAKLGEIRTGSTFLLAAEHASMNVFSDESEVEFGIWPT